MTVPMCPSARFMVWLLTACLACALLLAQTLGLMHGVVHSTPHEAMHERQLQLHDHAGHAHHADTWFESLFSSHDGNADCRLFDQASQGDAAPALAQFSLPSLPPSVAVAIFQGEALARWAALFDARGPPLNS
jgi:hypothetical protein